MRTIFTLVFSLTAGSVIAAEGDVYCFNDVEIWNALVPTADILVTNPTGVAEANEVATPPGHNTLLQKTLTFETSNTGLSRGFRLEVLESSPDVAAGFTFNDCETLNCSPEPVYENALSVGDINDYENDDWRFSVLSGDLVTAFAFILRHNDFTTTEESMRALSSTGQLLGECTDVPTGEGGEFFGFVVSDPVGEVEFDEGDGDVGPGVNDDDIAVADPRFGDVSPDGDSDGFLFFEDNCMLVANSDQRDTDNDGFGNVCDADLNNDCIVNAMDLGLFKSVFFTTNPDADFNGDGIVNAIDLGLFKLRFFSVPGPSGVQHPC